MKNKFVKILSLILALFIICLASSCGKKDEQPGDDTSSENKNTEDQIQPYQGDKTIEFGSYEQDNDLSNGKEPIEWIILGRKDGKTLVISKYCLDVREYHNSAVDVTWHDSSLRRWLNNEFLTTAFTALEQGKIYSENITNDDNPVYKTEGGENTVDKVFLLSINQANSLFKTDEDRKAEATAYAIAQGAYNDKDNANTWWWLRSPGYSAKSAANVNSKGAVYAYGGFEVNYTGEAIRPAMWIDYQG